MADQRHRHAAQRSRKRSRSTRSLVPISVLPIAGFLTLGAVGVGVVLHEGPVSGGSLPPKDLFAASASEGVAPATVSRSAERAPIPNVAEVENEVEGLRYASEPLEIHADAESSSPVLAKVAAGDTVDITGTTEGGWSQIIHKGVQRWVKTKSVTKKQPLGTTPCPTASERGLQPDTIKVLRAVCAQFPSIVRYGGVGGGGEHRTGQAVDIMVGVGNPIGDDVAAFVMEHRAELGVSYIIWKQRIWRPATSNSWRGMSDRGSPTANHYDHVHVTTVGNAAR